MSVHNEVFRRTIGTHLIPKIKTTNSGTRHYTMFILKKSNLNIQGPRDSDMLKDLRFYIFSN